MPNESEIRKALIETCQQRGKQAEIAAAFEIHPSTVKRWMDGGEIPNPICKLLGLYIFGIVPFDLVHQEKPLGTILEFTEDEWKIIEILALRAGQEPPQWIRSQILAYLDHNPRAADARKQGGHGKGVLAVVNKEEDSADLFWIDLHGGVAAGSPISATVNPEPIQVGKEYPEGCYALRVFGESMKPKINDGDLIVVEPLRDGAFPKKGSIVVYSDGNGSTLKALDYRKARLDEEANTFGKVPILKSLNPLFKDVETMEGGKLDAVYIETLREA